MNSAKRVLLLMGSPKRKPSNSRALGIHFLARLREHGFKTKIQVISQSLHATDRWTAVLESVHEADIVTLASPLYIDSLPYPVIKMLEDIAEYRRTLPSRKDQRLLAIVNSGFPEAHQNDTALAICRRFAKETGFIWAGGLGLGGGEVIGGKPLEKMKGATRRVMKALKMSADALASGEPIPEKAVSLMAKPMIPIRVYLLIASRNWRKNARKYGVLGHLDDQPYLK